MLTPAPFAYLELEKTSDVADGAELAVGDIVEYTFTVTNTGTVDLTDVTITDELPNLSAIDPASQDIPAGESATFTATYTITQDDIDNGQVVNAATATGEPPAWCTQCDTPISPPGEITINIPRDPALTVAKTADTAGPVAVGDATTYTFAVENTGNVTLTDVTLADPLPGLTWVTGPELGDLAPGDTATGTATYTVTQADVDTGGVTNAATVTGTPPESCEDCDPTSPPSEVTVPAVDPVASLAIIKAADPAAGVVAGDTITYTFTVENTGNVTIADVTIADPLPGLSWTTGPDLGTLAPGATATGTATYVVTGADMAAGAVDNSATATGTPPASCEDCDPTSPPSEVTVPTADPVAALIVTKTANTSGPVDAGDVITYTFLVENTGNVTITDATITDALPGLTWVTGPNVGDLARGETATGTATYTVTDADVAAGGVHNTAAVTGTPPDFCEDCDPTSPPSEVTVPAVDPGLAFTKTADTAGPVNTGDVITYTFTATNTGNVPLENVVVTDALPGLTWVDGPEIGTLGVEETATLTATYTVTEADVLAGSVVNTATIGCDRGCAEVPPPSVTVPTVVPGLAILKSAEPAAGAALSDTITYTFTVTNTGNVAIDDVTIVDALPGLAWVTGPNLGTLAPDETATGTATYVVTAADLAAGAVVNSATATGTPEGCPSCDPTSPPSGVEVPVDPGTLGLHLAKTSSPNTTVKAGETLTYTFVVTNSGSLPVSNVSVVDPLPGLSAIDGPHGVTLAPGESATFTATYVVTAADAATGVVINTATATGTGPNDEPVGSEDSTRIRACAVPGMTAAPTETPALDATPTVVAEEPTASPTDEPIVTEEPVETEVPTEEPIVTEEPTEAPTETEVPTEEPVVTEEPTEEVVPTEQPTEEPAAGRHGILGFAQAADEPLADCEPLPTEPVDPTPVPTQPAPQQPQQPAPAQPGTPGGTSGGGVPVKALPSTGAAPAAGADPIAILGLVALGALALAYVVSRGQRARR